MSLEITQNSQENTCTRVSFLINFIKKEALAQVFSCRFCEISKNAFFTEHLWATASVLENCKMRAKVDESYSCWEGILFRAPKVSIKGLLLFKILLCILFISFKGIRILKKNLFGFKNKLRIEKLCPWKICKQYIHGFGFMQIVVVKVIYCIFNCH